MKRPNFRICESCTTCQFVFEMFEYDEPVMYYCQRRAGKRPLCGSVGMNERFPNYTTALSAWDRWAKKNAVSEKGVCDGYKRKEGITLDE